MIGSKAHLRRRRGVDSRLAPEADLIRWKGAGSWSIGTTEGTSRVPSVEDVFGKPGKGGGRGATRTCDGRRVAQFLCTRTCRRGAGPPICEPFPRPAGSADSRS